MKQKTTLLLAAAAMLVVGAAGQARADVLFDFEGSVQSWFRFGPGTLDWGPSVGDGVGGSDAIRYITSLDETIWGGAVRSPNLGTVPIDLSQYTAFSADVQLSVDGLDPAYPGPGPNVELMLQLPGYFEWAKSVSLPADGNYYNISSTFADLTPQNVATEPITAAQLADPNLQIRVLLRNLNREPGAPTGKIRLRVDNVMAVPEPTSAALLALGGLALLRRRR